MTKHDYTFQQDKAMRALQCAWDRNVESLRLSFGELRFHFPVFRIAETRHPWDH